MHFPLPRADGRPYRVWTERVVLKGAFAPHTHDMTELVFAVGGRGTHVVGGEAYGMSPGDMVAIKPGTAHAFSDCRDLVHWNISFTTDMLGLCGPEIRRLPGFQIMFVLGGASALGSSGPCRARLGRDEMARVTGILGALRDEQRQRGPGGEALQRAWFIELAVLVSRAADPSREPQDIGRAALAASWLEECHAEAVTLDDLARHCGVSVRHLTRLFRSFYGTSPIDYLLRLRVAHAASLLAHGDRSVVSIALEVGFHDGNYLSRQFRRLMGCSPRAYRLRARRPAQRNSPHNPGSSSASLGTSAVMPVALFDQ